MVGTVIGVGAGVGFRRHTRQGVNFTDDLTDGAGTPVAITTPIAARQVYQRGRSTINLAGTYSVNGGEPSRMVWRVGSGDWKAFTSQTIGGGVWFGKFTIPSSYLAQGTLEVKPENGESITPAQVANITITDVWVVNGQSNSDGFANNLQTYPKTNFDLTISKSAGAWSSLTSDPIWTSNGSFFPALGGLLDQAGIPPAFARGSTADNTGFSSNDWNPGDTIYNLAVAALDTTLTATGGCAGHIWVHGERDAADGTTAAAYVSAMSAMLDGFETDITNFSGALTFIPQLGESSATGRDNIRQALKQLRLGTSDVRCRQGPNLLTEDYGDGVHYGRIGGNVDAAEAEAQLDRIAAGFYRSLYGSDRSAPTVLSFSIGTGADADKLTLNFDRAMENHGTIAQYSIADSEGARTIQSGAQGASAAQVVYTMDQALYGAVTVSFGEGAASLVAIEDIATQLREATAIEGVQYPPEYLLDVSAGTGPGLLPTLTASPSYSTGASVGQTAEVTNGTYDGVPAVTVGSFQWQRSDNGTSGWSDISGATSATYVIQATDEDKYLRRGEVATNAVGSAARAYSDASDQIVATIDRHATAIAHFSSGTVDGGIWYIADTDSVFQDRSATPSTAAVATDPLGTIKDTSGNDDHLIAPSDAARPTLTNVSGVLYPDYDGSDDTFAAAISWSSNMRVYFVVDVGDPHAATIFFRGQNNAYQFGFSNNGSGGFSYSNSGTPSLYINNTAQAGATQGNLYSGVVANQPCIIEYRNLDMSAWTSFQPSGYASVRINGYMGSIIAFPEASITSTIHEDFYNLLAEEIGISTI